MEKMTDKEIVIRGIHLENVREKLSKANKKIADKDDHVDVSDHDKIIIAQSKNIKRLQKDPKSSMIF